MKILVALDFSKASQVILEEAKRLALRLSAKLWLLHVAEPKPGFLGYTGSYVDYGSGYVDYGPDPNEMRKQLAEKFHNQHKDLQNEAGIDTTACLIQGEVVKVILQEARKLEVEMILIGSHGHGAVYKLLIGSVSEGVIKGAPCPVLLIPTHDRT